MAPCRAPPPVRRDRALTQAPADHARTTAVAAAWRRQRGLDAGADAVGVVNRDRPALADLADPAAPDRIRARVVERGLRVDLLVNKAGFGLGGPFLSHDLAQEQTQIHVDLVALVALPHRFVPDMVVRQQGGVINLASITSFLPMAYAAVYAASKSFVLSCSEALGREVAAAGVQVLAVCPGPVATKFDAALGANPPSKALDTPERIVADALQAFDRRRSVVIPGRFMIRTLVCGTRLLPRAINARLGEPIARQYFLAPAETGGKR